MPLSNDCMCTTLMQTKLNVDNFSVLGLDPIFQDIDITYQHMSNTIELALHTPKFRWTIQTTKLYTRTMEGSTTYKSRIFPFLKSEHIQDMMTQWLNSEPIENGLCARLLNAKPQYIDQILDGCNNWHIERTLKNISLSPQFLDMTRLSIVNLLKKK